MRKKSRYNSTLSAHLSYFIIAKLSHKLGKIKKVEVWFVVSTTPLPWRQAVEGGGESEGESGMQGGKARTAYLRLLTPAGKHSLRG